jgi:transposase
LATRGDDPRIPLDKNATERAIRGPVVGRKNHYGSKTRLGTAVSATLYTVLDTVKLYNVPPTKYLRAAVLVADAGQPLLPDRELRHHDHGRHQAARGIHR